MARYYRWTGDHSHGEICELTSAGLVCIRRGTTRGVWTNAEPDPVGTLYTGYEVFFNPQDANPGWEPLTDFEALVIETLENEEKEMRECQT